jgi:hypothetical protein
VNHLALFARWPEPGRVKTRLSPALPAALACDLYRALLADALAAAAASPADARSLHWAEAPAGHAADPAPGGFEVRDQRGADLGERLEHATSELLGAPGARVLVIGADCPDLDAARIAAGFAALKRTELVLGPARDGGYYLIGLARPASALFRGVDWGTSRVLAQTRERARALELSVTELEPLDDLDTPADLARWAARAAVGEAASGAAAAGAPRTRAALRAIGLLPGAEPGRHAGASQGRIAAHPRRSAV